MLVSRKLLEKFVNLDGITSKEIADKLTFAGIEVEDFYPLASASNLVIGEVKECEKIKDSVHLHLTKVDLGSKYGVAQIVCGAPNVRAGLKVIVALPGAKLGEFTIKKTKIKGYESNGMICSLVELGVDTKYLHPHQIEGIEELDIDAPVGNEEVLEYLLLDDVVFDVRPLPNRSDTLAVINLAKEIAALFDREFKPLNVTSSKLSKPVATVKTKTSRNKLFAIKEVYGVKVSESPLELQRYLMASGQRAINNIVDIANFVMLLTGQPLHMYDIDKLPTLDFVIKDDVKGSYIALDNNEYELIPGDICITVNDRVMCLGGVMGAKECEVTETSKNIAIEAAHFDGASIRHTSTRLNLPSEASKLFARGTNPHQIDEVLNLTSFLLRKYAGVTLESEIVKEDLIDHSQKVITGTDEKINSLLGTTFTSEEIDEVLRKLYFEVERKGNKFNVTVPHSRLDVFGVPDLAEEVIRFKGFEHIKEELPIMEITRGGRTELQQKVYEIRTFLRNNGLFETVNYTLIDDNLINQFVYLNFNNYYEVKNPMTPVHKNVRTHLLPSLLETAKYNYARQLSDFGLFEVSHMYLKDKNTIHLGVVFVGDKLTQDQLEMRPYDFYDAKGIVEGLFEYLRISKSRYVFKALDVKTEEFHPYRSAKVYVDKKLVGVLGELHPNYLSENNFAKTRVIALELDLALLLNVKTSPIVMHDIPKYPSVSRDFAFVVSEEVSAEEIVGTIKSINRSLILDVAVFDIYRNEKLGENRKSIAINVIYQASDHTLEEKEINELDKQVRLTLEKKFNTTLRE